jgi:hypothetical protein
LISKSYSGSIEDGVVGVLIYKAFGSHLILFQRCLRPPLNRIAVFIALPTFSNQYRMSVGYSFKVDGDLP